MNKNPKDSSTKDTVIVRGIIDELLPSANFKVRLETGQVIQAYLSGKMRMHKIRLMLGDEVKVEMTPYDLTRGRIIYRY